MRTENVPLRHARAGLPPSAALRAVRGREEIAIDGVDTRAAVTLLGRLMAGPDVADAGRLSASDRDALLAALHRQCWGDRIVSTLTCESCGAPFDLSFELSAVQRSLTPAEPSWQATPEGRVVDGRGASFCVPTGDEELEASAYGIAEAVIRLAAACGADPDQIPSASDALESVAPLIDLDLRARCADCGHEQLAHFDVQSFVLQRLLNERDTLLAEIHLLATSYGWSLDEILSLPRETRQSFTRLVSDAPTRAGHAGRGASR